MERSILGLSILQRVRAQLYLLLIAALCFSLAFPERLLAGAMEQQAFAAFQRGENPGQVYESYLGGKKNLGLFLEAYDDNQLVEFLPPEAVRFLISQADELTLGRFERYRSYRFELELDAEHRSMSAHEATLHQMVWSDHLSKDVQKLKKANRRSPFATLLAYGGGLSGLVGGLVGFNAVLDSDWMRSVLNSLHDVTGAWGLLISLPAAIVGVVGTMATSFGVGGALGTVAGEGLDQKLFENAVFEKTLLTFHEALESLKRTDKPITSEVAREVGAMMGLLLNVFNERRERLTTWNQNQVRKQIIGSIVLPYLRFLASAREFEPEAAARLAYRLHSLLAYLDAEVTEANKVQDTVRASLYSNLLKVEIDETTGERHLHFNPLEVQESIAVDDPEYVDPFMRERLTFFERYAEEVGIKGDEAVKEVQSWRGYNSSLQPKWSIDPFDTRFLILDLDGDRGSDRSMTELALGAQVRLADGELHVVLGQLEAESVDDSSPAARELKSAVTEKQTDEQAKDSRVERPELAPEKPRKAERETAATSGTATEESEQFLIFPRHEAASQAAPAERTASLAARVGRFVSRALGGGEAASDIEAERDSLVAELQSEQHRLEQEILTLHANGQEIAKRLAGNRLKELRAAGLERLKAIRRLKKQASDRILMIEMMVSNLRANRHFRELGEMGTAYRVAMPEGALETHIARAEAAMDMVSADAHVAESVSSHDRTTLEEAGILAEFEGHDAENANSDPQGEAAKQKEVDGAEASSVESAQRADAPPAQKLDRSAVRSVPPEAGADEPEPAGCSEQLDRIAEAN